MPAGSARGRAQQSALPALPLSAVGAGPSPGSWLLNAAEDPEGRDEDSGRRRERDVNEGHPQSCKCSTSRCRRRQRYRRPQRQPWLQIAVVWLLLATEPLRSAQPRSPWKEGGEGKRLRRGGRAARATVGLNLAPEPSGPFGPCLQLSHEGPQGSWVGGDTASGASNYWRLLRMQHGSWVSKTGFIQSAGKAGAAGSTEHLPAPPHAGSPPCSCPRLGARPGFARGPASPSPLCPLFSTP